MPLWSLCGDSPVGCPAHGCSARLVFISQRSVLQDPHLPMTSCPVFAHSLVCHAYLFRGFSAFLFAFWLRGQLFSLNDLCSACLSPPLAALVPGLALSFPMLAWPLSCCYSRCGVEALLGPPPSFGSPRLHHPSLCAVTVQSG